MGHCRGPVWTFLNLGTLVGPGVGRVAWGGRSRALALPLPPGLGGEGYLKPLHGRGSEKGNLYLGGVRSKKETPTPCSSPQVVCVRCTAIGIPFNHSPDHTWGPTLFHCTIGSGEGDL